jgi:dTDP-D-glucose 4,6-dehydratase
VASNELAKQLLDWEPKVLFREGLRLSYEWYCANKKQDDVQYILENGGLIERKVASKA